MEFWKWRPESRYRFTEYVGYCIGIVLGFFILTTFIGSIPAWESAIGLFAITYITLSWIMREHLLREMVDTMKEAHDVIDEQRRHIEDLEINQ
jgi:hypothetical protein